MIAMVGDSGGVFAALIVVHEELLDLLCLLTKGREHLWEMLHATAAAPVACQMPLCNISVLDRLA